jgi:hypothetical protein
VAGIPPIVTAAAATVESTLVTRVPGGTGVEVAPNPTPKSESVSPNSATAKVTVLALKFAGRFAAQILLREFVPDLLKATHKLHASFPRIPVPEWWVKLRAQ